VAEELLLTSDVAEAEMEVVVALRAAASREAAPGNKSGRFYMPQQVSDSTM
jgi:hypothetical protein